jgi:hypothetical protein
MDIIAKRLQPTGQHLNQITVTINDQYFHLDTSLPVVHIRKFMLFLLVMGKGRKKKKEARAFITDLSGYEGHYLLQSYNRVDKTRNNGR